MKSNVLGVALLVACALGLANGNRYPAGVDPRSCPNYPNCDNTALHGASGQKSAVNSWDEWDVATLGVGTAAQYPAGVNPQSCPNYPDCDNVALHGGASNPYEDPNSWGSPPSDAAANWNSPSEERDQYGSGPAAVAPRYPAGVNAQNCPNYPYCY